MASYSAPEPSSLSSMPRIPMTSSTYPPSTPRPRPASRRSASSYQLPTARPPAYHSHHPPQHHRTASSSAALNFSARSHPFTSRTITPPPPPPPLQASPPSLVVEPHFSRLFTTVLGSPFLTTPDPLPHLNGVELDMLDSVPVHRPASPSPTADFSMIDVDPDDINADYYANSSIPGAYPYSQTRHGHGRSMSSMSGFGFSRGATFYNNSPAWGSSGFTGSSPTPRDEYAGPLSPSSSPQNPLKSLLPRLWDVLSSPGRAVLNLSFSTPNNPMSSSSSPQSSRAGSPSISPRGPTPGSSSWYTSNHNSGRQSPVYWSTPNLNCGKGKSKAKATNFFSNTHTTRNGSRGELSEYINYSELPPLDGEEGELIDDEACFIDVRAVTGIDILGLLPPELALQILMMLSPPPLVSSSSYDKVPSSSASQSEAKSFVTGLSPRSLSTSSNSSRPFPLALSPADQTAALHDLLACRSVSRTWCRLASDNDVWRVLFLGRWEVDLRRGGKEMQMKMGYYDLNKVRLGAAREMLGPTWDSTWPSWAAGRNGGKNTRRSGRGKTPKFQPLTFSPTVQRPMMTRSMSSAVEYDRSGRVSMNGSIKSNRPIISAPLQLDWRVLYRERLELDKRWSGIALMPGEVNPGFSSSIPALGGERGLEMQQHDGEKKAFEPQLLRISGHTDSVYCLEFDSRRIVTGSRDRTIKVWSLRTGKLLGTFRGVHKGSVLCLKFEKDWDWVDGWDGSDGLDDDQAEVEAGLIQSCSSVPSQVRKREGFMVSGSSDCSVCVWKLEVGDVMSGGEGGSGEEREVKAEMRAVLKGHIGGVLDLRIDNKWIVSCSKDAVIRVWDRQTLELHRTLRGHEGPVNAVGFQSGRVVSASGDGKMILWDIASGERLRTFEGHDRGLACIEFKDDMIVSGSNDCKIKVWCASTGECLQTLVGHEALVRALSFDSRSGRLVSASYDKTVKLWDLRTGKLLREFKGTHTSHIFDVKFDVARIVSTSHDQKIVVLDFSAGLDASLFI